MAYRSAFSTAFFLGRNVGPFAAVLLVMVASLAAAPRVEDALTDPGFGQNLFRRDCALCHYAGPGSTGGGQGPSLVGVLGKAAGARSDFSYTPALRESGLVWDAATLDRFLANPTAVVPGTTMVLKVPQPNNRRDLIAYLATLTSGGEAEPTVDPDATDPNDWRNQKPGRRYLIRPEDLPAPYATRLSRNFPFVVTQPDQAELAVPAGFTVSLIARNLNGPRLLQAAPNGDIFITEMRAGRVRALRLADGTGAPVADEIFAEGLDRPYGISFYPAGDNPQWLYLATHNSVVRFPYRRGDLKPAGPGETIVPVIVKSRGGHGTRTLAFSRDGRRMFIGVGSGTNAAEDLARKSPAEAATWEAEHGLGAAWDNEFHRANVLVTDPAGKTPLRVYASGLRNPTGLAVHPQTGDVYAAVNERDSLGDDLVPDYLTRVREGGFYGWPWYYVGRYEDPRHAGARPDLAGKVTVPDVLFQAHSAALGIAFYTATSGPALFPPEYRGDAFVALHGSWNRQSRTGYKVVRVRMQDGRPTGGYEDFLVGFVSSPRNVWGRPVGLAVTPDGALLVTDDENGTLWRVAGPGPVTSSTSAAPRPHVYLVGDSTMSDMPPANPRRGWGMLFPPLFAEPGRVKNLAVNGESTRSCVESGHWKEILARLEPGDFVLIQYGHNDEVKEKPERYTEPAAFAQYLRTFVREVRDKGAVPLLATPVCRRKFDPAGRIVPTHGPYPAITRAVAKEENVPLLDLERVTTQWLESVGEESSRAFFMGRRNPRLPPGKEDIEHFVEAGAAQVAELAANEIRAQNPPLARLLR